VSKKWYNYFVVTTPANSTSSATPSLGAPAPPSRRVVDVVPDAEGDATFTAPVATPTDLAEIYRSARSAAWMDADRFLPCRRS
jgi:hypothetical protein